MQESEKYTALAQKYQGRISYQIHKLEQTHKYGWQDTLVFSSSSLVRTKEKIQELEKQYQYLIVVKIDPLKQEAKWIYATGNIEKKIGKKS